MISTVVFDLAGVVFDWSPTSLVRKLVSSQDSSDEHVFAIEAQIFQNFHPCSDWAQFDLGVIGPTELARRIVQRSGLDLNLIASVIEAIPHCLQPIPDTVELIKELHLQGVPLYFLSNMPGPYAAHLLAQHGVFRYFRDGIFSAEIGQIKPDPRIFRSASVRFGALGRRVVFIDDTVRNVKAAEIHGWKGLYFTCPEQCRKDLKSIGAFS